MGLSATVVAKKDELASRAELMGRNLAKVAFGEKGPDLNVSLLDLEQFFDQIVKGFAAGMYGEAVQQQAGRLDETAACPTCGRECPSEVPKTARSLETVHGPLSWDEPRYRCPHCERLFFPSADHLAD